MADETKASPTATPHEHVERRRRPQTEGEDPKQTVPGRPVALADQDPAPATPVTEETPVAEATPVTEAVPADVTPKDVAPADVTPEDVSPKTVEPAPSFADLFDGAAVPQKRRLQVGDAIEGAVLHVGADGAFVDAGNHQQAFYPRAELLNPRGEMTTKVGDVLKGHVVKMGPDGTPELGRRLGAGMSLDELQAAMDQGLPIEGKVTGVNKGGVAVDLGGLRAFCPIGQLDRVYVADASVYLQQTLRFEVLEIKEGRDVVLTRKRILEREAEKNRAELLAQLKVGDRKVGTVVRIRDFGAFVELAPGIDGLIPTRELSHDRRRADQVVSTGQSVEVMVQEITQKGDDVRIGLSLKALADDPWDNVSRVASPGQVTQGVVRRLMDFGAFVELAPGIEGLLHISELGGGDRHPSSFVSVGEPLLVTVKSVDEQRQRIALAPAPEGAAAGQRVDGNQPQVGDIVKGTVERHESYGIFVQVEGIPGRAGRGLIHERELGLAHGVDMKKAFPLGAKVEAKVVTSGKLGLSIKAIAEDEARREVDSYKASQASKSMGTLGDLLAGLKK